MTWYIGKEEYDLHTGKEEYDPVYRKGRIWPDI